jgi:hypothetical protein
MLSHTYRQAVKRIDHRTKRKKGRQYSSFIKVDDNVYMRCLKVSNRRWMVGMDMYMTAILYFLFPCSHCNADKIYKSKRFCWFSRNHSDRIGARNTVQWSTPWSGRRKSIEFVELWSIAEPFGTFALKKSWSEPSPCIRALSIILKRTSPRHRQNCHSLKWDQSISPSASSVDSPFCQGCWWWRLAETGSQWN